MNSRKIQMTADRLIADFKIGDYGYKQLKKKHHKHYPEHWIRSWAKSSAEIMCDTVVHNISASEELSIFPYNYDAVLDDTILTTPYYDKDLSTIVTNYLNCYHAISQLAKHNHHVYKE